MNHQSKCYTCVLEMYRCWSWYLLMLNASKHLLYRLRSMLICSLGWSTPSICWNMGSSRSPDVASRIILELPTKDPFLGSDEGSMRCWCCSWWIISANKLNLIVWWCLSADCPWNIYSRWCQQQAITFMTLMFIYPTSLYVVSLLWKMTFSTRL